MTYCYPFQVAVLLTTLAMACPTSQAQGAPTVAAPSQASMSPGASSNAEPARRVDALAPGESAESLPPAPLNRAPETPGSDPAAAQHEAQGGPALSVEDEPLASVMRAISSRLRQPITVSRKAGRYKVSGQFELSQPMALIESLANELGLIWYFDGRVVYIYDNAEAQTVMLSLPSGLLAELIDFLKSAALYDPKYPFGATRDKSGVYFSGPPKYVEIVNSAVEILKAKRARQAKEEANPATARRIEVVKLKHALVPDRSFTVRGDRVIIPGIASVLQQALAGSVLMSGTRRQGARPRSGPDDGGVAGGASAQPAAAHQGSEAVNDFALGGPGEDGGGLDGQAAYMDLAPASNAAFSRRARLSVSGADAAVPALRVIPYADSNSLLLEGMPRQIAGIKELIATLDQPKRQIEMSLWVIDISKGDAHELGAQFGISLSGPSMFDVSVGLGASAAAMSREQATKFIARVTALSREDRAQVVSRPILLTQDNMPAIFDNSHTYFVKLEGYKATSLEKVTYGTMINVLPHVASEHGRIEMMLDIEDGNRDANSDEPGTVNSTQISTVARVMHEQSLLVGGYTLENDMGTVSKIPILGDIPYLGALFRYKKDHAKRYVRMFLIQPRVLPEDATFEGADGIAPDPLVDNAVDALRRRLEQRVANQTAS